MNLERFSNHFHTFSQMAQNVTQYCHVCKTQTMSASPVVLCPLSSAVSLSPTSVCLWNIGTVLPQFYHNFTIEPLCSPRNKSTVCNNTRSKHGAIMVKSRQIQCRLSRPPPSWSCLPIHCQFDSCQFDRLKLSANSNEISAVDLTVQNRLNVLTNCSKTYSSCIESHNICTNTRKFVKKMLLTSSVQK